MPDLNYISRDEFNRFDKRISVEVSNNTSKTQENSESIVELKTMHAVLMKLPDTMASLEKAINNINTSMNIMDNKIEDIQQSLSAHSDTIHSLENKNKLQDENIIKIDNKGKIDWIAVVTSNFWKIILVIGVAYAIIKDLIIK